MRPSSFASFTSLTLVLFLARHSIEALYKRIHKHVSPSPPSFIPSSAPSLTPSASRLQFDQSSEYPSSTSTANELVQVVADEAQGELCGVADRFSVVISRCYVDAGVTLDFSSK